MHGTSQRTGYLPVLQGYKYRNRMEKWLYESRKTPNVIRSKIKRAPIYDWGYVTGTRRVVLETVVKCQPGDTFSAEAGLTAAMLKKYMGNDNTFNKVINEWLARASYASVPALPETTE